MRLFYYLVIVPLGMVSRLFGGRSRELTIDPKAASYWRSSEQYSDLQSPR